jgi:hypothetical protein
VNRGRIARIKHNALKKLFILPGNKNQDNREIREIIRELNEDVGINKA